VKTLVAAPFSEILELKTRADALLLAKIGKPGISKTTNEYLEKIGWELYPWQDWVLKAVTKWRFLLLIAARQVGKTLLAAGRARYQQISVPLSVTPVVCPNQEKSKILIKRVTEVANKDPDHTVFDPDNTEEVGEAGSIIKGLPGTLGGVVGETAPLLMLDEAGLIGRQLYDAATPMQAHVDNPELWVMSSAWWKIGWLWDAWDTGPCKDIDGVGFVKVIVRPPFDLINHKIVPLANQDKYVEELKEKGIHAFFSSTPTREFLEQELSTHTEMQIRQQYFCEFQSASGAALDSNIIHDMFTDSIEPMFDAPSIKGDRPQFMSDEVEAI
jgi:hypothetical protein